MKKTVVCFVEKETDKTDFGLFMRWRLAIRESPLRVLRRLDDSQNTSMVVVSFG